MKAALDGPLHVTATTVCRTVHELFLRYFVAFLHFILYLFKNGQIFNISVDLKYTTHVSKVVSVDSKTGVFSTVNKR